MNPKELRSRRLYSDILPCFSRKQHRESFEVFLDLLLDGSGRPLPERATVKSPSALSRFLNHAGWDTRHLCRVLRRHALKTAQDWWRASPHQRPRLELLVDLTSLEKTGQFAELADWVHTSHGVRGVHLVVLYLCCGELRLPWAFQIWRGKGKASPAQLALKLLRTVPATLLKGNRRPRLHADGGFESAEFIRGVLARGLDIVVGVRCTRKLEDGRQVRDLMVRESLVKPIGLDQTMCISWVWLYRNTEPEQRTHTLQRRVTGASETPPLLQTLGTGQPPPAPIGFVWQTKDGGVFLRETPQGNVLSKLPNTTRLQLLRYEPKRGLYAVRTPSDLQGWVPASHLKIPPTALAGDANLKFYVPQEGEGVFKVIAAQYGATEFRQDARYFTNVLRAVNKPEAFKVTNPKYQGFLEGAVETTLTAITAGRDANGIQLKGVTPFWLPSPAAAAKIKVPSCSFSKGVIDTTRRTFGTAGEQALYTGAFMTGMQVGVLKNLWDALVGLVDLVKLPISIIRAIYNVIQTALQGNLMAKIGEIYTFLVEGGLKQVANLLVAEFKAGWDNKNPLKAWEYRGQVIGYVATEILTTFIPIAGLVLKAAKAGKVMAFLSSKFGWISEAGRKAMAMLDKVQVKWPPPGMSPQLAAANGLTFTAPSQQVSLGAVLRKAGKKVLDAAGLPVKTVLTNKADIIEALYWKYPNFNAVKGVIGSTVNPDAPPLGYLYAKLPFNGKTVEYLYLPGEDAGKVPLLVIKNGKVDFDLPGRLTLTRKVDSKGVTFDEPSFTPGYRMASMYAQGFRKVLNGANGHSQLHHLIPDNVARAQPLFQEAMKRGLFGLDEQTNIVEVAEDAASLKTAQTLFQQGQTSTLLPPLVHRGPPQ
ncbi:transposase [Deinococcus sp. Leaf326]|uniref:transposase n=1 Tax=Deinococcus sp. Leaf326 TaxID=1736338 RepID=UPI0006FB6294|nr:transposase [Deinococcus sp. Leaf326]KQR15472.1 hypothetical protein ASF71_20480 [Deinococcus sp. Leaf326]